MFVSLGQTTFAAVLAVFGLVSGGWSEYSRRRHADLVEYFVTDQRIVVHSDEEGEFAGTITFAGAEGRRRHRVVHIDRYAEPDLRLREIDHAQRVFAHVQRARHAAPDTPAE